MNPILDLTDTKIIGDDGAASLTYMNKLFNAYCAISPYPPREIRMTIEQIAGYMYVLKPSESKYPLTFKDVQIVL